MDERQAVSQRGGEWGDGVWGGSGDCEEVLGAARGAGGARKAAPKELGRFLTFVASCLRGALPPVDFRAVCLVRAIFDVFSRSLSAAVVSGRESLPSTTLVRCVLALEALTLTLHVFKTV